jgi:hypothetical protein
MKVVVYTAIMGNNPNSDTPIDIPGDFNLFPEWDYVLITNHINAKQIFKKSGWNKGEIRIMEPPNEEMPYRSKRGWAIYAARWFKWHPDKLFSEYDVAIWIDGWQIPDFNQLEKWNNILNSLNNQQYEIILDLHEKNKCIYKEHKDIVFCQKDTYENMCQVSKYIELEGFPKDFGLYWTGCYVYKIGSKSVQKVLNNLWDDMRLYTYRDQALLTFEIWRETDLNVWGTAKLKQMVKSVYTDKNHSGYL